MADGEDGLQVGRESAADMLSKKSRIAYRQRYSSLEIWWVLTLLTVKAKERSQGTLAGSYKHGNEYLGLSEQLSATQE
jgi:hypothetical protein